MATAPDTWELERQKVLSLTDRLGNPVDVGIIDAVITARLSGLRTFASCWGHANRGCNGPWLDIIANDGESFDEMHQRVCNVVAGFNSSAGRRIAESRRIVGTIIGNHETHKAFIVRIECETTRAARRDGAERLRRDLVAARRQMTAFTRYLRSSL